MTEAQKPWAYAIMSGQHPDGTVLVEPKMAADPRGKLPARPLLDSIAAAADNADTTLTDFLKADHIRNSYGRMLRGVERQGDAHTVPYARLVQLADAAGVNLSAVYTRTALEQAHTYADAKVQVGNRGYDVTLDLAKSVSVLYAMADRQTAHQLETVYLQSVRETIAVTQDWVAYGMRGHHGDGQRARRIDSTGLLGWMMVHRTARPVEGAPPDPHLHVHVVLANMVHGVDGKWSTVGAGGRDIHRHAHAADAFLKARMRAETHRRWGIQWRRHAITGAWEIAAIPAEVRDLFSKRSIQIDETLARLGLTGKTTSAQTKLAAAVSREAKQPAPPEGELREQWHRQARSAGFEPEDIAAASLHAPQPGPLAANPTPEQIAAYVFRDEPTPAEAAARGPIRSRHVGLTHNRKVVSRADVLAAVIDALPYGLDTVADAEHLVDQVVAVAGYAIALDKTEPVHLSNSTRYTTAAIVKAEHTILRDARDGLHRGIAVVPRNISELAVDEFVLSRGFGFWLSDEQQMVLDRLLHGGHQVDAVIGVAGSGKTTLMAALRAAYEAAGMRVAGASNSAVAAANLQAESGIASATVDSWLARADWTNKHGLPIGLRGVRAAQAGPGGTPAPGRFARAVDVLVIDEAATVDDRKLARLLDHAIPRGIKIIAIGDPKQLRAPGVGGTFARVHQIVDGPSMMDNRRQRDETERRALQAFRSGQLHEALADWSTAGRVHVVADSAAAQLAILARWEQARHAWSDVHDRIANLLVLTGTNDDAEQINHAIQAVRLATGDLDRTTSYTMRGGGTTRFAVGDEVMVRVNARSPDDDVPDLLNGYRGVVTDIDTQSQNLTVQWRAMTADGPAIQQSPIDPAFIADGGLSLGYAMTVAKAQGLTAQIAITYGIGLDPHTLYAGMTRARAENHLILPIDMLESEAVRARLGPPRSPEAETRRAVAAYARWLQSVSADDALVLDELANNGLAAGLTRPDPEATDDLTQTGTEAVAQRRRIRQHADRPRARHWQRRQYGTLTATELSRALIDAEHDHNVERARATVSAERHTARLQAALDGHGLAATALADRRQHIEQAEQALRRAEQRMQTVRNQAAVAEQIRADLARPAPVRFMLGIRADEAQIRLAETNTLIAHAQQAAELARANAERRAVEAGIDPARIPTAAAQLRATWNDTRQAAIDNDVAAIGDQPAARADLARTRLRLSSLRTEQETRMRQHPEDGVQEQRERDTARTISEREWARDVTAGVRRQWEREVVEGAERQWERDAVYGAERQWEREMVLAAEQRRQRQAEATRARAAEAEPDIAT